MGYYFRTYETVLSKAQDTNLVPIVPGRHLICTDTGDVFYDTADKVRKHLTDIIDVETDAARKAILAPLNKFYFVKETAHLWRYVSGVWVDLTPGTETDAVFLTLTANGWSNKQQVLQIDGLKASQNGIISLTQDISAPALAAAKKASLRATNQATGTLTMTADGTIPSVDIPVVVILWKAEEGFNLATAMLTADNDVFEAVKE